MRPSRSPARKLRPVSNCSPNERPRASRKAPESSPAVVTPIFFGPITTAADRRSKSSTASTAKGKTRAAFPVTGATFHDWEDIAIDDAGHLYLGDIGNNDAKRDTLAVYEIDEPDPAISGSTVSPRRGWTLKFPGAPFDCESLFIWKDTVTSSRRYLMARTPKSFAFPSPIRTSR